MSLLNLLLFPFALISATQAPQTPRHIEERFLAPCCWRENLVVHRSQAAEEMRAEIRVSVGIQAAESEGNRGTVDLLEGIRDQEEKALWMLSALLK